MNQTRQMVQATTETPTLYQYTNYAWKVLLALIITLLRLRISNIFQTFWIWNDLQLRQIYKNCVNIIFVSQFHNCLFSSLPIINCKNGLKSVTVTIVLKQKCSARRDDQMTNNLTHRHYKFKYNAICGYIRQKTLRT